MEGVVFTMQSVDSKMHTGTALFLVQNINMALAKIQLVPSRAGFVDICQQPVRFSAFCQGT
jgi:hypothetical protein